MTTPSPREYRIRTTCATSTPLLPLRTGQLFVWQMRAAMHPVAIIAMVPKPNSSAPMSAPIITCGRNPAPWKARPKLLQTSLEHYNASEAMQRFSNCS